MRILHEVLSGFSTFFAISYLLVLCPQILSESGLDFGAALTATVLTIVFSTLFFALYASYPIAAGPGLSVMTYLAFSVAGKQLLFWPQIFGLVFWAGFVQLFISIFGWRRKILSAIPQTIQHAAAAGLGLFFLTIGLKQLNVLQVADGKLSWGHLGEQGQAIGALGTLLLFILHWKKIPGAYLIPVLFCWIAALVFGLARVDEFVSLPPSLQPSFGELDWSIILHPSSWGVFASILLIAIFDSGATLAVLAKLLGWQEKSGMIRNLPRAVIPDGVASMLGGILGTTNCSIYAESSVGIHTGGRTALTGCIAGVCCLIALFFHPAISSIPLFATAPALFGIGTHLAMHFRALEWKKPLYALPFLATSLAMPLFFSIYWGFALGFISYALLHAVTGQWRKVHPIVWGLAAVFAIHLSHLI